MNQKVRKKGSGGSRPGAGCKKLPYRTTTMRVPVPLKEKILELVEQFKIEQKLITFKTYELAKSHLSELGYNFLSGNEIFATFVNATGSTAFVLMNEFNAEDNWSIEIKK